MVAGIETSRQAYENSQWIVIAFAVGSILLALGLGDTISAVADRSCQADRSSAQSGRCRPIHPSHRCHQSRRTGCIGG